MNEREAEKDGRVILKKENKGIKGKGMNKNRRRRIKKGTIKTIKMRIKRRERK